MCEDAVGLNEEVNIIEKYTPDDIADSVETSNAEDIDEIAKVGSEITKEADKAMDEAIKNTSSSDSETVSKEEASVEIAKANAIRNVANNVYAAETAATKAIATDIKQINQVADSVIDDEDDYDMRADAISHAMMREYGPKTQKEFNEFRQNIIYELNNGSISNEEAAKRINNKCINYCNGCVSASEKINISKEKDELGFANIREERRKFRDEATKYLGSYLRLISDLIIIARNNNIKFGATILLTKESEWNNEQLSELKRKLETGTVVFDYESWKDYIRISLAKKYKAYGFKE